VAEEVRAELRLEAVRGARLRDRHDAGVVDQDVDPPVEAADEGSHRRQVRDIELAHLGRAAHLGPCRLPLG